MLYHEELFTRSQCSNCQQEIPGLGIECAECLDGKLRLCADCFSIGSEVGIHKNDHRYRFFETGSLALFPASGIEGASTNNDGGDRSPTNRRWSAREEIRLLDAIEQYGFGNWFDTSRHIESRLPTEAKAEFVQRFVEGSIGQLSWGDFNNNEDQTDDVFMRRMLPKPIDNTVPCDEGPLSPSLTQRLPPLDISSDETLALGYMPFRDDYEKEYDNEAEKLVAQLAFTAEDDETDVALKLALVDMYCRRLRERARRKRVIRDYQLVCKYFKKDRFKSTPTTNGETNGGKESSKRFQYYEKQIQEKLRPFAQFYNSREFDHLIRNLVKEKELRVRLQELYKYRSNGITRPEECVEFERTKIGPGLRGKRSAAAALAATGPMLETLDEDDDNEDRSYKRGMILSPAPPTLIQQLQQPNLMQDSPNPQISPFLSGVGGGSNGGYASRSHTPLQFSREDFSLRSSMESNVSELALLPQLLEGGMDQVPLSQQTLEENSFQLNEKQRGMDGLYTANFIPGAHQLTQDELNFCIKINLLPAQFLTLKLAFILGRLKNPQVQVQSPSEDGMDENSIECPPNIQKREWDQILDFLFSNSNNNKNSEHIVT